jgi:hypothetical protein
LLSRKQASNNSPGDKNPTPISSCYKLSTRVVYLVPNIVRAFKQTQNYIPMTGQQQQHQDEPAETQQQASSRDANILLLEEGPRLFDVLFGRGRGAQEHLGNVVLQEVVKLHRSRYQRARRMHRNGIAQEIVQNMKHGGPERQQRNVRFLKREEKGSIDECWVEVSDKDAARKVCHALRIRPVSIKQGGNDNTYIEEEGNAADFRRYDAYSPYKNTQLYSQQSVNKQKEARQQVTESPMPNDLSLEIASR